ncbi:hypothetical protein JW935_22300 [candidate division KSB1 bacterium]|nr:hypothetical protein [candidate division KSB1 bacterium]
MKYTSEFDNTSGICTVRVTGEYRRPDDSDKLKHFAIDFFMEHGCRLFLFDMTQTRVISGTMPTFNAANPPDELAQSLRKIKTAFVRRELDEDDRFFENVAVNRGFPLRAFDSFDKAVEWLKQCK